MESDDVMSMRDLWECGKMETEEMYVIFTMLFLVTDRCNSLVQQYYYHLRRLPAVVQKMGMRMFPRQGEH